MSPTADPAITEPTETVEAVPANAVPDDVLSLMRDALRETTPAATEPEPASDPEASGAETTAAEQPPAATDATARPSRRAKTVEKVRTEAEQKVADAEARAAELEAARAAAEARAAELEAKVREHEQRPQAEAAAARAAKLAADYGAWLGTPEEYAEAQRWSRMDNTDPQWDFDRHQREVAKLNTLDERRRWAGEVESSGKAAGRAEVLGSLQQDFLVTLANDLPEGKRDAYRTHKDGLPGAVRFYAETVWAPKLEALEAQLAEKDAEIERLRTTGSDRRAPLAGATAPGERGALDRQAYERMSPQEMMAAELAEQQRRAGRR